jgi:hypothetical protein
MILFRLAWSPVKLLLFVARIMGYSRFAIFLIGVVVGLALAPTTGAEFRAKVRELVQGTDAPQPALP